MKLICWVTLIGCVTDDIKELEAMKLFAIRRLNDIYNCRVEELNKKDSDK